jgi:hypothetical protein
MLHVFHGLEDSFFRRYFDHMLPKDGSLTDLKRGNVTKPWIYSTNHQNDGRHVYHMLAHVTFIYPTAPDVRGYLPESLYSTEHDDMQHGTRNKHEACICNVPNHYPSSKSEHLLGLQIEMEGPDD